MCGRFSLSETGKRLADYFGLDEIPTLDPQFNIAPSQDILGIRIDSSGGVPRPTAFQWGLVPFWAKDPKIGSRMINARAETVATKPSFRRAFQKQRILVPASGFYEWQKIGSRKQPHFIFPRDKGFFAFAGIWESWQSPGGQILESCALITTEPNSLMKPIHNRMPVILKPDVFQTWLDPKNQDKPMLEQLLLPMAPEQMKAHPVTSFVNNPRNQGPQCIEPA